VGPFYVIEIISATAEDTELMTEGEDLSLGCKARSEAGEEG